MLLKRTNIPGCFEILPQIINDERGRFVKTFHRGLFQNLGLNADFPEEYYTVSKKGVLRGLHFQTPPSDHTKIVYCVEGEVFDAVVDLRVGSPTFGKYEVVKVSSAIGNIIYIPSGLAHGFYVVSENATLIYNVSTVYSPQHDSGILWNSVGIPWPDPAPIVSRRDTTFPSISNFTSPFTFNGERKG